MRNLMAYDVEEKWLRAVGRPLEEGKKFCSGGNLFANQFAGGGGGGFFCEVLNCF